MTNADNLRDILAFELAAKRIEIHFLLAHLRKAGLLTEKQIAAYCTDVAEELADLTIKPGMQKVRDKAVKDYTETAELMAGGN